MEKLKREELENISGGSASIVILGIFAVATIIAGIIDGITRPLTCHE